MPPGKTRTAPPAQRAVIDPFTVNEGFKATNADHRCEIERLALEVLEIDPTIQREEQPFEIARIASRFNPDALGTITVSARRDPMNGHNGYRYFVIDGQQRSAGARLANYQEKMLAVVHYNLTVEEEAQLFLDLNYRRGVGAFSQFKTRCTAGEPQALAIRAILQELEIPLGPPRGFMAVTVADKIYQQKDGPARLRWALQIVKDVYNKPGSQGGYNGHVVEAFSLIYAHFITELDEKSLRTNLAIVGGDIDELLGFGRVMKRTDGGKIQTGVANAIVRHYNMGKHANAKKSRQLPKIVGRKTSIPASRQYLAEAAEELGTDV